MLHGTPEQRWARLGQRMLATRRWVLGFHGSPREVARGMAIGVFVAFTPLIGLQMIIAAILATFVRANRAAAVAAVWITNPLTALPIYLLTYRLGRWCFPPVEGIEVRQRLRAVIFDERGEWLNLLAQLHEIASLGTEILVPLSMGGAIVGGACAIVAYVATRRIAQAGRLRLHLDHDESGRLA